MAIEAGIGEKVSFQVKNITVPTNAGADLDILSILAAASVPIAIQRMVITSNQSSAQTVPILVGILTATGSGGASTNASVNAEPPSGGTPGETITYNNTTPGTLGTTTASSFWQIFNAYEFNRKPGGLLITPAKLFVLRALLGGVGSSFAASIEGEYIRYA